MSIRSVSINEGLVVAIRRGFEPVVDSNGTPPPDLDDQRIHAAEAVIPGRLPSRFADTDGADLIRLLVVGHNPGSSG